MSVYPGLFFPRTILLVDLRLHVEVDTRDDQVGDDVERAHAVEDSRIVERYLLGDLHKSQDDDQVGTAVELANCLQHRAQWIRRTFAG